MPLELPLFELINQRWTCAPLDFWGALVSASDMWILPAFLTLAWIAWRGGPRGRMGIVLAMTAALLSEGVIVRGIKTLTARTRPAHAMAGVRMVDFQTTSPRAKALFMAPRVRFSPTGKPTPPPRSFPSGHTWTVFAIATVVALAFRRRGWIAFIPALGVAYARVYAGIHWPTDVLASAILSPLMTWALVAVLERAWTTLPSGAARWIVPVRVPADASA